MLIATTWEQSSHTLFHPPEVMMLERGVNRRRRGLRLTGVDKRYRGRKLAQAVKVLALRYAREVLKVNEVRTNHNSQNDPMLAVDRKFGYVQTTGSFVMVKKIG